MGRVTAVLGTGFALSCIAHRWTDVSEIRNKLEARNAQDGQDRFVIRIVDLVLRISRAAGLAWGLQLVSR
jgi:hypothetical protein